jgi:hypothetical protein
MTWHTTTQKRDFLLMEEGTKAHYSHGWTRYGYRLTCFSFPREDNLSRRQHEGEGKNDA